MQSLRARVTSCLQLSGCKFCGLGERVDSDSRSPSQSTTFHPQLPMYTFDLLSGHVCKLRVLPVFGPSGRPGVDLEDSDLPHVVYETPQLGWRDYSDFTDGATTLSTGPPARFEHLQELIRESCIRLHVDLTNDRQATGMRVLVRDEILHNAMSGNRTRGFWGVWPNSHVSSSFSWVRRTALRNEQQQLTHQRRKRRARSHC